VLAGADGTRAWGLHAGDATPRRGMHLDGIAARAGARDDAQVRRARHQTRRDASLAPDDERVRSGDDAIELAGLPGDVEDFDLRSSREEIETAGRQTVGDHPAPPHANA